MLRRTFDIGVPAAWVTADEVYGSGSKFHSMLEKQGIDCVVTISCQQRPFLDGSRASVDEHTNETPNRARNKISCGDGAKGKRFYQWAFIQFGAPTDKGLHKGLLVKRSLKKPDERVDYFVCVPKGTTLKQLVRIAGSWRIVC